jgi:hypothetical protein
MDSQYNVESTQQTTTTTSSSSEIGFDKTYLQSVDSILKIVEMVRTVKFYICYTSYTNVLLDWPSWSWSYGSWIYYYTTVKPVYKSHSREPENVTFMMSSWPLYTG